MNRRKRIILIILSALLIFSVAACGKAEDAPKGEENTPPVEQDPPAQEEPPSEDEEPSQEEPSDENRIKAYEFPEKLKKEIEDAMYDATGYPEGSKLPTYIYYGTHSGYSLLYFPTPMDVSHCIYLHPYYKKYPIRAGYYFEIHAYKDGAFFPIWEICKQGVFTAEDMEEIYNYHYAYKY